MLEVISGFAKLNLETEDFVQVIRGLNETGYKSVIWQSKIAMLAMADITVLDKDMLDWIKYYRLREDNYFMYRADLFVDQKDVIYFINHARQFSDGTGKVEIGIITERPQEALSKMGKYARAFIKILKAKVDGRRVRHMNVAWYALNETENISTHVTFYKNFTFPMLDPTESDAANYLTDSSRRELLKKIAESGAVKLIDIRGSGKEEMLHLLEDLVNHKLVAKRYIVTCRRKSIPIGVVESKDELTRQPSLGLTCAHCGKMFADELLQDSFMLNELGKKMIQSSHWMMVFVTQILIKNGIPEKNIIWSLSEDSEEIDCAVQFKNNVWIFELKDRDFEAGDAHPLNYRAVKFKAGKTIIITTGKVTKNARKVFEELSKQNKSVFTNGFPFYIEGLASINDAIATLVKNETLLHVLNKSKQISQAATIDFSPIFSKLFGKYIIEYKGEFTEHTITRYV